MAAPQQYIILPAVMLPGEYFINVHFRAKLGYYFKEIQFKYFQICKSVSGDSIAAGESSLIIVNHRTRLDWNFLWSALFHYSAPESHNAKLVLKDQIRKIPGIGTKQGDRMSFVKNSNKM
jgi:1-acyl-sn-glycerol-3-phosphate acyltransferase